MCYIMIDTGRLVSMSHLPGDISLFILSASTVVKIEQGFWWCQAEVWYEYMMSIVRKKKKKLSWRFLCWAYNYE